MFKEIVERKIELLQQAKEIEEGSIVTKKAFIRDLIVRIANLRKQLEDD